MSQTEMKQIRLDLPGETAMLNVKALRRLAKRVEGMPVGSKWPDPAQDILDEKPWSSEKKGYFPVVAGGKYTGEIADAHDTRYRVSKNGMYMMAIKPGAAFYKAAHGVSFFSNWQKFAGYCKKKHLAGDGPETTMTNFGMYWRMWIADGNKDFINMKAKLKRLKARLKARREGETDASDRD